MKKGKADLIEFKLTDCETHGMHISDVNVREVEYHEAEGHNGSTSVGYSPVYAANWEANFGEKKPEPELN